MGNDDAFIGATELPEEYWSVNLVGRTDWRRTAEKANYRRSLLAVKQVELAQAEKRGKLRRAMSNLPLSENHRRVLSVVARSVEQSLDDIEKTLTRQQTTTNE